MKLHTHIKCKSITGGTREGGFEELVKKEGVRVRLHYGVVSEWTSFVTVVKKEDARRERERTGQKKEGELDEEGREETFDFIDVDAEKDDDGDSPCNREIPSPGTGKMLSTSMPTDTTNNSSAAFRPQPAMMMMPSLPPTPTNLLSHSRDGTL